MIMKKGTTLLAALLFGSVVLSPPVVRACECAANPSQQEVYKAARAVFIGQVIDMWQTDIPLFDDDPRFHGYAVKFKVAEYWKGVKGTEFVVLGGFRPCTQFEFTKGQYYLVYAEGKKLIAWTGCTRNRIAGSDSAFLQEMKLLGKSKIPKPRN